MLVIRVEFCGYGECCMYQFQILGKYANKQADGTLALIVLADWNEFIHSFVFLLILFSQILQSTYMKIYSKVKVSFFLKCSTIWFLTLIVSLKKNLQFIFYCKCQVPTAFESTGMKKENPILSKENFQKLDTLKFFIPLFGKFFICFCF